jgi:drug/metabolite transporter (DMT)-like permease
LEFHVFIAVVLAAFLHAAWNVLVKFNLDRFLALFLIHVLMGFAGLGMLAVSGLPASRCWPYALASGLLHAGYNLLLARSYRDGEMSLVYPIARGAAPAISLGLSLVFSNDTISMGALAALAAIIAGLWFVAMGRPRGVHADRATLGFAFATAMFIGMYTVTDGLGARVSGDALAYSGLIYALDGAFLLAAGLYQRGKAIIFQVAPFFWRGMAGSLFSSLSYGIVIWAMTQAPIAMVAALRETSILFALAMSGLLLKESLTPLRLAGGALIVIGAAGMRFV